MVKKVQDRKGLTLMKTVLLTGASGFIGQAMVEHLEKNGYFVLALARDEQKLKKFWSRPNINIITCASLSDSEDLFAKISSYCIDYTIHLAWAGNAGSKRNDVELQLQNVLDTVALIKVLQMVGCNNLIMTGTISENLVLDVEQKCNAASMIYASAKVSAYAMAKSLCSKLNINFTWCRLANIYGPENTTGNLMSYTIEKLLSGEKTAYSSGNALQDFMYIDDCVRALRLVMEIEPQKKSLYYVGTGQYRPLKEYLLLARDVIAPNAELGIGKRPDEQSIFRETWFSIENLQMDTGFVPKFDFKTGITNTVKILRGESCVL